MTEKVIDSIRCYLRIDDLRIEAGNLLCPVIDAIDSVGSPYPYIFVFVFTHLTAIIHNRRNGLLRYVSRTICILPNPEIY